jgi:hypothetical protein
MEEIKVKNKSGLTLTITQTHPEDYDVVMGGLDSNPLWKEYILGFKKQYQPHIRLLRKGIIEAGWIGKTGGEIANDWCFIFSDGVSIGLSWRAWGDLMQAIINKREGYMAYYM